MNAEDIIIFKRLLYLYGTACIRAAQCDGDFEPAACPSDLPPSPQKEKAKILEFLKDFDRRVAG
jgi:hypothetical protein